MKRNSFKRRLYSLLKTFLLAIFLNLIWKYLTVWNAKPRVMYEAAYRFLQNGSANDSKPAVIRYDGNMPLIFIGGIPRSGTTLMRAIVDSHSQVRCGEETRVLPRFIGMFMKMYSLRKERERLQAAGVHESVMKAGIKAFALEVIVRHGEPAPRLCNKDPLLLQDSKLLVELFPKAKLLLMLRDGRAVVNSIFKRKVTISGFDVTNFTQCLVRWNKTISRMYFHCRDLGSATCLPVKYEDLVLHPEPTIRQITKFLDLPWEDSLLHHEKYIGKQGGVAVSQLEKSTSQIVRPINLASLTDWVHSLPKAVRSEIETVAPMLRILGYDPNAYPPNYGTPDKLVLEKMKVIQEKNWKEGQHVDSVVQSDTAVRPG